MSGHSHYATIHRQKDIKDAQKGKIFSKLGKAISIAVKAGGSPDPDANAKLRFTIDQARAQNMPKENIERAISKASGEGATLEEVTYEGFGPAGVGVLVQAATDNKNRTAQEMKNAFERGGGNLAGPGSVSFNFDPMGLIILEKQTDSDSQMLKLIDMGAQDIEESGNELEVYVNVTGLSELTKKLESENIKVLSAELIQRPKTYLKITDSSVASKIVNFLDNINELEDVQNVFSNVDIPEEIIKNI